MSIIQEKGQCYSFYVQWYWLKLSKELCVSYEYPTENVVWNKLGPVDADPEYAPFDSRIK